MSEERETPIDELWLKQKMVDYGAETIAEAMELVDADLEASRCLNQRPRITAHADGLRIEVVDRYGQLYVEHFTGWEQVLQGVDITALAITPATQEVRLGSGMWRCGCGRMVNIANAAEHGRSHGEGKDQGE